MGVKKAILGILLGVTVLCHPILSEAHERQCPRPIEVTQQEAQELMKIAFLEAGNQGVWGQLYVMSCIINRTNSPGWPDSIHDVINEPHQFATKGMASAEPTPETHYALAMLEMGTLVPDIIAFEKVNNNALDQYFSESFEYGDHTFYTQKK